MTTTSSFLLQAKWFNRKRDMYAHSAVVRSWRSLIKAGRHIYFRKHKSISWIVKNRRSYFRVFRLFFLLLFNNSTGISYLKINLLTTLCWTYPGFIDFRFILDLPVSPWLWNIYWTPDFLLSSLFLFIDAQITFPSTPCSMLLWRSAINSTD